MPSVKDILKKYGGKLSSDVSEFKTGDVSRDYETFKQDMMPSVSRYEKWARSFGNLLNLNMNKKDEARIQKQLDIAHLDITPGQVASFSFLGAFIVFAISALIYLGVFFYFKQLGGPNAVFLFMGFVIAAFVFYYIYSSPKRLANLWRLKASAQMVPCILYVVVYMKHTSNLERAISFASQHLQQPLSLDLKKIFWDVEVGKFSTIKESLDNYLKTWEDYSLEFVEAFHLIESSLYEPSDARRILTLEKSLQVILDGVYEKMLVFSREVRSPLTNVYMLGIVLPTLGLALLPLASTLLGGVIRAYHVFILFNLIVPFFVFYLTTQVLMKRPGGYGESDILELNPDYHRYKSKRPYVIAGLIALPLILIGLFPLLVQFGFVEDLTLGFIHESFDLMKFFDFKDDAGKIVGPFGVGALILSLFIPLGIGMFFSIAFSMKTKELIKARKSTKQLEREFSNSLFQLGNRLGDGVPAEVAFARVAESTKGQKTSEFFKIVNLNLHRGGMSLEKSIFDQRRGAIIYFPSNLIRTSMGILLESVKKGLRIAAESLMSISEYLKNIQKVTQRLNDLLAEVVSDMKSNMVFLAPLLSGIVIGLAAMITMILNMLTGFFTETGLGAGEVGLGIDPAMILETFDILKMIPPYYLQIAIGIYIVQVIFILTGVLVTINSGNDKLKKTHEIAKNLKRGVLMYFIIALVSIVALSALGGIALGKLS